MKKVLLTTAAVGLAFAAMPAHADIDLETGGFLMGYGLFVDQEENDGNVNDFDFAKNTEIYFTGETTLDNGLTVGAYIEFNVDEGDETDTIEESYAYFSGSWGRVNFGEEDGAAYLLQVAAPSADKNVDGLRAYIDGVNKNVLVDTAYTGLTSTQGLDYDQALTGNDTKLTYLSPVISGFQAGVTYAPDAGTAGEETGVRTTDVDQDFGAALEVAGRYEGEFEGVGVTFGLGYSHVDLEENTATAVGDATDDRAAWNVGLDLDIGPFGIGASYKEDDHGEVQNAANSGSIDDEETFVVGADYTTGPFKLGASYYDAENVNGTEELDAKRYTGGVVYTYGPGMTLSGSLSYVEYEDTAIGGTNDNDVDATSFLIGTKIKF